MKPGSILFFLLALRCGVYSQEPLCGLSWLEFTEMQKGIPNGEIRASFHNKFDSTILHGGNNGLSFRSEITVPVVVHIVWNTPEENLTDGQVLEQMEILNRDCNRGFEGCTGSVQAIHRPKRHPLLPCRQNPGRKGLFRNNKTQNRFGTCRH